MLLVEASLVGRASLGVEQRQAKRTALASLGLDHAEHLAADPATAVRLEDEQLGQVALRTGHEQVVHPVDVGVADQLAVSFDDEQRRVGTRHGDWHVARRHVGDVLAREHRQITERLKQCGDRQRILSARRTDAVLAGHWLRSRGRRAAR